MLWKLDYEPSKILDFDIETRRIGFHSAGMFAPDGCEPIAIGWSFIGEGGVSVETRVMNRVWSKSALKGMVQPLFRAMREADLVTGHYIRKFDLPILAGVAMELGLTMPEVQVIDTKVDLKKVAGLSQSQENLSLMLGVEAEKFPMADNDWREGARLTRKGLDEAQVRVEKDVRQHMKLYEALVEEERLHAPSPWRP